MLFKMQNNMKAQANEEEETSDVNDTDKFSRTG